MGLHLGSTRFPACIRFYRGTISAKGYKDSRVLMENPIKWWIGISWRTKWFLGFIKTDRTVDVRE